MIYIFLLLIALIVGFLIGSYFCLDISDEEVFEKRWFDSE